MDSPAIESKNKGSLPPVLWRDDLVEKLRTYAASGEDDIVVVMRKSRLEKMDEEMIDGIKDDVTDALDDLPTNEVPDEIDIKFVIFKELSD